MEMVKEIIKQIINEWDPLYIAYMDENEYRREIQEIYDYINITENISKELLTEHIFNVFNDNFGTESSNKSNRNYSSCLIIAEKIINSNR